MNPLTGRGRTFAVGADLEHSGKFGAGTDYQGQSVHDQMQKCLRLTLLSTLGASVDIDRWPATLRGVDVNARDDCCRICLQGTFSVELKFGHSSEAIEAIFCPRRLSDTLLERRWRVHTTTGTWKAMMAV